MIPAVAWIETIQRKGGKSYRVFWRDPSRRVRSKTFSSSREARSFSRSVEVRKDEGSYVDPSAGRVTFGEFVEHFLETSTHLKPSSRNVYRKLDDLHLLPTFGKQSLGTLTVSDVKGFLTTLGRQTGSATVRGTHRLLRRALNGVEEGRLTRNPAARAKVPAEERHHPRFLMPEESRHRQGDPGALLRPRLSPGLRRPPDREAAALRVKDVDLLRRRVTVRAASVEVEGVLIEAETKGGGPAW